MPDYADRARRSLVTIANSADALAGIIDALEAAVFNIAEAATSGNSPSVAVMSMMKTKLGEARARLASLGQNFDSLQNNLVELKADLVNFSKLKKSICRDELDGFEGKDANAQLDAVEVFKRALGDRQALVEAVEGQIVSSQPSPAQQAREAGGLITSSSELLRIANGARCPIHPGCVYDVVDGGKHYRVVHGIDNSFLTEIPRHPSVDAHTAQSILKSLATGIARA
ncbi:hypothetical protein HY642_01290 [Candidatus Woesearchaeota archaeon]|nr:hypothetical protein [Candidatus Woesearchaeota archaeon]